jgi:DNA-directed RNA polymerase alpha subunit
MAYYKPIEELDISTRAINELHSKGVTLITQIVERTDTELIELGLSKKTLNEILKFRDEIII